MRKKVGQLPPPQLQTLLMLLGSISSSIPDGEKCSPTISIEHEVVEGSSRARVDFSYLSTDVRNSQQNCAYTSHCISFYNMLKMHVFILAFDMCDIYFQGLPYYFGFSIVF